jgi:hypothetical protein
MLFVKPFKIRSTLNKKTRTVLKSKKMLNVNIFVLFIFKIKQKVAFHFCNYKHSLQISAKVVHQKLKLSPNGSIFHNRCVKY